MTEAERKQMDELIVAVASLTTSLETNAAIRNGLIQVVKIQQSLLEKILVRVEGLEQQVGRIQ